MLRYSITTVLLLLAAFLLQQFLPAFTGLYDSRILLVQLVFLCCAVTVSQPVMLLLAFLAGCVLTWLAARRATRIQNATGIRPHVWPVALGTLAVLPLVVWFAMGAPLALEMPVKGRFRFDGGGNISPELIALMIGLVLYHSAFAAEIAASGTQSVPSVQWEAGLPGGAVNLGQDLHV